ncbi:MAG: hypothetical protein WA130_02030 [Candidatus Methanoperedens sp.]
MEERRVLAQELQKNPAPNVVIGRVFPSSNLNLNLSPSIKPVLSVKISTIANHSTGLEL